MLLTLTLTLTPAPASLVPAGSVDLMIDGFTNPNSDPYRGYILSRVRAGLVSCTWCCSRPVGSLGLGLGDVLPVPGGWTHSLAELDNVSEVVLCQG